MEYLLKIYLRNIIPNKQHDSLHISIVQLKESISKNRRRYMFEIIAWINMIYQLIMLIFLIGIIYIIVSVFRKRNENNKRIKRIEEKVDNLIENNNKN